MRSVKLTTPSPLRSDEGVGWAAPMSVRTCTSVVEEAPIAALAGLVPSRAEGKG